VGRRHLSRPSRFCAGTNLYKTTASNGHARSSEPSSQRTRAALAAAKGRGVRLGNRSNIEVAQDRSRAARMAQADQFASNILPVILQIRAAGVQTLNGIAEAQGMNSRSAVRLHGAAARQNAANESVSLASFGSSPATKTARAFSFAAVSRKAAN
jgi:hypothetical protein